MPLETVNFFRKKEEDAEKFTPTSEELRTIREKMRDPEFVQLFQDYMKSMEDPETRREEEAYLQQVEREAKEAGDCSFDFVFPLPGFVVELLEPSTTYRVTHPSLTAKTGSKRQNPCVYVNMCSSKKIDVFREETTGDSRNSNWHVPVSISKPRTEIFSEGSSASATRNGVTKDEEEAVVVYDAVFHPDTLQLADRSDRFCCFLVNIAVEHINTGYGDRHGFQFRRVSSSIHSVGTPQNQTITRPKGKSPFAAAGDEPVLKHPTQMLPSLGACDKKDQADAVAKSNAKVTGDVGNVKNLAGKANTVVVGSDVDKGNLPRHTITHRGHIDLSDTWGWKVVDRRIGVPEELVVKIEFDRLQSASDLALEVEGAYVTIAKSTAHQYHGVLTLPFSVEPTPVEAKFERRKSLLTLVLRVIPPAPAGGMTAADVRQHLAGGGDGDGDDGGATSSTSNLTEERSDVLCKEVKMDEEGKEAKRSDGNPTAPDTHSVEEKEATGGEETVPAPQLSFIGDQDRVRLMMEKVQAARRDREKLAEASRENFQQRSEEPKVDTPIPEMVGDAKGADDNSDSLGRANGVTEDTFQPNAEEATTTSTANTETTTTTTVGVTMDGAIDSLNNEAEMELLKQRQDAWRMDMQQRIDSKDEEERQAALAAEREARREAERLRRRVDAAKLQEAAEAKLRERMAELPLQNKHIFAID